MGVYIKDMEMPTSCGECKLVINCDSCEGWECYCTGLSTNIGYESEIFTDKRRDDCPLVPVQPHGRLIDADALEHDFREDAEDAWNKEASPISWAHAFSELADMVADAPTVIPAEEGE